MKSIKMGNIFSTFLLERLIKDGQSKTSISLCIGESEDFVQDILNKKDVLNVIHVWRIKDKFEIDVLEIILAEPDAIEVFSEEFKDFLEKYVSK